MWPFEISNSILRNIEFSFHLFHFHRFRHLFRYCSILLPCEDPELCTMTVSRGTRIEQSEDFDEKTTVITRPLWIPDERQITGQYLHSLDLSSEDISMNEGDPVTRFAHPAWDGGTYWLRSTPIAAASDASDISSGTEANSFLTASRSGRISSAVATDLHALRIGMCLSCPT